MTALGKLFPHDDVQADARLSAVFALFAAFLLGYFALEHAPADHRADHRYGRRRNHRPGGAISHGGIRQLVLSHRGAGAAARVEPLSRHHLQRRRAGRQRESLRPACSISPGWTETTYRRLDETDTARASARLVRVFQLPGGFRLLVGRDLDERERLYDIVLSAGAGRSRSSSCSGIAGGVSS